MTKIGLVVEGGGMKCAYGAGVLDGFIDGGITFDYGIGVSAGSANLASFLAGQRGRNLRFYTQHIHESGYFGLGSFLKTGDLFGLQYIYGTLSIMGGADYVDYDAIMANPCEYEVVGTNALTGEPTYFNKSHLGPTDLRIVMASSAIPAACKPIFIDGVPYYDGGVSDSIPVERALERGCDKLVVVLSKKRDYVKNPEGHRGLYKFLCRKYPKAIEALDNRHLMYRTCQARTYELEREGRAFVFAPEDLFDIGTYTMDEHKNQQLYDQGLAHYCERADELAAFLQG